MRSNLPARLICHHESVAVSCVFIGRGLPKESAFGGVGGGVIGGLGGGGGSFLSTGQIPAGYRPGARAARLWQWRADQR